MERTLAIIKPDAVKKGRIGKIIERIEREGFSIKGMKMIHLTEEKAGEFYIVHKDRPFYESLKKFMSSGEIVVMVLERENAIKHWRDVMGDTDPVKAPKGTIRAEFGTNIERNAVHGSDTPANAEKEIPFFFSEWELV
ncbi:MAG: nucleoside-diphosphate kinase [Candidatus Aminicenantia bacterium]